MSNGNSYDRLPLVEALLRYEGQGHVSMHVPGHKDGAAYVRAAEREADSERAELYRRYAAVLRQDVTEVDGTDDLHQATGPIREAQELAAACFGAEATYFLVGGSTAGNVAALLTCCSQPGDIVLVQRNVHKSIINGLKLAGARAVFVSPRQDRASGLLTAPSVETVEAGLVQYPQAKAVFLCSPNYYGLGVDIQAMAEAVHRHGVPLFIDEAHGAHYGLHPDLPQSALQAGADLVVQSTHKMLLGMTMSAMLHIQGPRINRDRLQRMLAMVQSSSPSYPLMASLDMSRHWVQTQGDDAFTMGLAAVSTVRKLLHALKSFDVLDMSRDSSIAYESQDPFKLVIRDVTGQMTGYELLNQLTLYGVVAEMADIQYVVLLFTLANSQDDAEKIVLALRALDNHLQNNSCMKDVITAQGHTQEQAQIKAQEHLPCAERKYNVQNSQIEAEISDERVKQSDHLADPIKVMSESMSGSGSTTSDYRPLIEMNHYNQGVSEPVSFSIFEEDKPSHKVDLEQSIGKQSAESVIPYPPGIPLIYAGERITKAHIDELRMLAHAGAKCQDVSDPQLRSLIVYEDVSDENSD
ncbi:aminotransferase class I/II-fold pyridoxal phosphate-dependent enzyme [Paenibacillus sp. SC116]|uniref:aminotransferase class I/II-fold pyridoxal phosphate-dependent enzyme n=1 Tax=Paenibacillus sp. SC116 TaxID=2968986 RepID=UPI00215B62AB|nr:aminotransferase class I/II-fold pyridoxal phosphate-dependent enzyme [Paenibacillus sp. SC116]MCR8846671.1 aminotransferase class I/II-fold pyridoxal phosphate-dependent enzyme [Paenibacillus sp. SC116]